MTIAARFEIEAEGSWSGPLFTSGTMTLTLTETNGVVTGNGTIQGPGGSNALSGTGTYIPPNLSLTLSSQGFSDANLSAVVGKTSMVGTLNGSGFNNEAITLNRQ